MDRRSVIGWTAVALSALFASLAAFWGAVEAFHEGWYYRDWKMNVAMTLAQYLAPMLVFMVAGVVAVRWPRVGAALHLACAGAAAIYFHGGATLILVAPLAVLALLYAFGSFSPKWAACVVVAVPTLTMLISGAYPAYLAFDRVDDGERGARTIRGNGVTLVWAPPGPGWPDDGVSWEHARTTCDCLSADGRVVLPAPQHVWRLPTVEEAVRSAVRHGGNAGGSWDATARTAAYRIPPNKESPLWNKYSKIVYWWTATETDAAHALRFVWNGQVHPAPKQALWGYLAYRCVRSE